jgi:co-chaperonin GroES (HSP10)
LHDRIVVRRITAEEKTKGGIIIPDTAQEKPSQGEVTAVGPGGRDEAGKLIPIDLKVGDRVVVIPAHACTTANLHPGLLFIGAGEPRWEPVSARGWDQD